MSKTLLDPTSKGGFTAAASITRGLGGKLSLSLGDNNWHVRLQQMTTAQCLKYFGQNISFVPERNSVNLFEHCQGLSLKVLISFFKDTFNENSHARGGQCTMTDKKRQRQL